MDRTAIARIGALVKAKRRERDVSLRVAALECGVSPSTLSRLERGASASLPEADTLAKLATWFKMPVDALLRASAGPEPTDGPSLTIPDVVEARLRADKRLSPDAAHALAHTFRLLYEQFAKEAGKEEDAQ
jgi:transcriptional regulator with XRE-family HTH domain